MNVIREATPRPLVALATLATLACALMLTAGCDRNSKASAQGATTQNTTAAATADGEDVKDGDSEQGAAMKAEPPATTPKAPELSQDVGMLWRIEKPKGTHKAYLFGTIHVAIDAKKELKPVIWEAIEESDTFVMEADVEELKPENILEMARLPKGKKLKSMMSEEGYKDLKERANFMTTMTMDDYQPWFVLVQLQAQVMTLMTPMDVELQRHAANNKKKILFLESVQEQLDRFKKAYGVKQLEEFLKEYDEFEKEFKALVQHYRDGDLDAIGALLLNPEEIKKKEKEMEIINYERNDNWIPQFKELFEKKPFIAVGVGHMIGDRGLLTQLKERGYHVERIN